MRKLLLSAAVVAFAGSSAIAANLPLKAPLKAPPPPPAPVANWTGFYVDGGFGYGMWTADTTTLVPAGLVGAGTCILCVPQTQGGKGWLGTVGGGYDYQFKLANYNLVVGALGSYDFGRLKGTIQDQFPFFAGTEKMTSAWAAGARLGWLVTPSILTYVNGGWSGARFSGTNMVDTIVGGATGFSTPAFTRNGYFIGSGTEYMFAPGWFARAEYRYADYGTTTLADTNPTGATTFFGNPVGSIKFHPVVQTARTELVYKFNWGGQSSAIAANMPLKAPPPPAPVVNWTGLYVDGGFGYGMWTADTTTLIPAGFAGAGTCILCVPQTQGGKGWLGTVGGGYDYQFGLASYNLVVGALGSYDFSRLKGTIQDQNPFFAGEEKMTSAWAAGARLGWLVTPSILTYVNGGWSGARFSGANMVVTVSPFSGGVSGFSTPAFSRTGYFIGSGTEIMFAPGWFARAEYRYADYGTAILPDMLTGIDAFGSGTPQASINFHPVVQTARTELVYKFNWIR